MKYNTKSYKDKRHVKHPREECRVCGNNFSCRTYKRLGKSWLSRKSEALNRERLQAVVRRFRHEPHQGGAGCPESERSEEKRSLREKVSGTDSFIVGAKRYTNITELRRLLKIVAHEKSVKRSKHAEQLEIYYADIGYVCDAANVAKMQESTSET